MILQAFPADNQAIMSGKRYNGKLAHGFVLV